MGKVFNITADCKPELHYMVNIDSRLKKIKELIDKGEYFAINRARQYGKTTTLRGLSRFLQKEYLVADMDFQTFGDAKFKNENVFSMAFARVFIRVLKRKEDTFSERMKEIIRDMEEILRRKDESFELQELFEYIIEMKIWHGEEYHRRGEEQLAGYLEDYHQKQGYLISFNFNKNKKPGIREVRIKDKIIIEAVI